MKDKFNYIKSSINKLASIIEAPEKLIPTFGNSTDSHPNIEISDTGQFSYEIFERGQEIKRDYALDLDHLLYIVFRDITGSMAIEFASKNSQPNVDIRRVRFQKQLELLGKLKREWEQKEKEYQAGIASQIQFTDYAGQKDAYLRYLIANGFLYSEAIEKANTKFP
ncbi:MAG: hypothetical protein JWR61_4206 [Ferruginibacter sp.]|uniref:Imm63 family immunity protein n=1 Tax=Ferruginibacter sp. TaxID=1940288 RepID=UPI002659A7EC|nr:Imm63 family immunity protein [Ferruginibacter sp.]MDB5279251.1 hypothetical protein [Ferruginibacter sp.]